MPPPHFQTMCWPSPTWIPVLVSRSSNPGIYTLPDSDGQVFVFHFPGVIQRVICGVPNQIPQRPGSGHFALSMERPNGGAIGVAVRLQTLVDQHRTLGSGHPDLLCPLLLHANRMTDDLIPITPSPSRTLLHLSRHAQTHVVEKRPARLHQGQFTFQFSARYVLPIDARERERDAPEVGGARARIVLDHVNRGESCKLSIHPSQLRHLGIAWKVGLQPFNRGLPGLRTTL